MHKRRIFILLFFVFCFFLGAKFQRDGILSLASGPFRRYSLKTIKNYFRGVSSSPQSIIIDVGHLEYQKLLYKRKKALELKTLFKEKDDYVGAVIRQGNNSYKVSLRLKGDHLDHLQGDKWSFRVRVKGGKTIFGMRQFSLQSPLTRNYIYEWIYHTILKKEGVISLRYEFVNLIVNGKDLGIYALEEHFEKRLIEFNRQRVGPIIRFNEDLFWRERAQAISSNRLSRYPHEDAIMIGGSGSYLSSDIDSFLTTRILSDETQYSYYIKAVSLLEAFREGRLKTSDVFDLEKLAKYFAITDLLGAEHGSRWHNARFYYNPITSRLEPIGFDADCSISKVLSFMKIADDDSYPYYYSAIFSDLRFLKEYIKQLDIVSQEEYSAAVFKDIKKDLEKNLNILYREFPNYDFSKNIITWNQKFIQAVLNPTKALHAYLKEKSDTELKISIGNIQIVPIEVLGVFCDGKAISKLNKIVIIPAKKRMKPVEYSDFIFPLSDNFLIQESFSGSKCKIVYRLLGKKDIREEIIFPWPRMKEDLFERDLLRQEANCQEFGFIDIHHKVKSIVIRPGAWTIDKTLIIPKGYKVLCREGTSINLINSASIISFSPFEFIGSREKPIKIYSQDLTGQGIIVLNAQKGSTLKNVIFLNLSNPKQIGWGLTGAVTFYESKVNLYHCKFESNYAEDALNIIRSDFYIEDSLFKDSSSDALDLDFTTGTINNTSFINCGNDAIDISGSFINMAQILIEGAKDKGISLGEGSTMNADFIEVRNSNIGIVSKDSSRLLIKNIFMNNCNIGFAAYQKKPEFGPAIIKANNFSFNKLNDIYFLEDKSTIVINQTTLKSNQKNLKSKIYNILGSNEKN